MGSGVQRNKNGGKVEHQQSQTPHKLFGTQSGLFGHTGFCQGRGSSTKTLEIVDRQHDCGGAHQQERRHTFSAAGNTSSGVMDILFITPDLGYAEASPGFNEFGSRSCIPEFQHPHGMEVESGNLSTNYNSILHTGSGFICVSPEPSAPSVCNKISRSRSHSDRWLLTRLEPVDSFHSSSNNANPENSSSNEKRQGNRATDSPELARPTLVSRPVGNVGGLPCESTSQSVNHSSSVCSRRNSPTVEDPSSSGMASFRSRIEAAGIPEDVCQIIMASWRGSTQQRYEGLWKLWSSWCIQRQKCPFSAPVNDILAFLTEQFNNRRLVYKACISQLHDPIEGRQVGNLPLVSRFMKGIFELRPPQPKLCSIWPVSKVLSHFAELEPLDSLSLKALTLKLIILLALTSAARAHELAELNLASALIKPESYEFSIPIHAKNARPNHPPRKIVFTKYNENSAICVVKCLNHYLTRTKDLLKGNKLLISYVKPHQEVGSQTVSRWLCAAIQQAGVEMSFTGHSTRAAATSEATDSGIPLELVLEAADWSSTGTFEKHYYKQTTSRGKFAKSVLGLHKN